MLRLTFLLSLLLGGCVSLDDVVGGIANTPEWFQERRVEIRGEGYPSFDDVPEQVNPRSIQQRLARAEGVARENVEAFLNNPRTAPVTLSNDDMEQLAASLQAQLPLTFENEDKLLTDREIAALRAQVKAPPIATPK